MGYTDMDAETDEARRVREANKEIDKLKEVIVDQAKRIVEVTKLNKGLSDYNQQLEDSRRKYLQETYDRAEKESKIKHLLKLAEKHEKDTTTDAHTKESWKIRIEALNDVINILAGKDKDSD